MLAGVYRKQYSTDVAALCTSQHAEGLSRGKTPPNTHMKNTPIVFLALALAALPVAKATEFADYHSKLLADTTLDADDALYTDATFSVVLNLDIDALKAQLLTTGTDHSNAEVIGLTLRNGSGPQYVGIKSIYTSSGATTASLWSTLNGIQGRTNLSGDAATYLSTLVNTDWANADAAAFCLTYDKSNGTNTYLTVSTADDTYLTYNTTDSGLKYGSTAGLNAVTLNTALVKEAYTYTEVLSAADAAAISKIVMTLPEPATATLSLLALAALAARRRR